MANYCIFSAQYLPTVGGVENFSFNLAKRLLLRGNKVAIVTSQLNGLPQSETDENGIFILRLPSIALLSGRLPVVKPNAKTAALVKEVLSWEGCRVIVNTRFYPLSLYAVRQAKKMNRHCIVVEHGSAYLSLGNPLYNLAIKIYEHSVCSMVKHYCNSFYAISARSKNWLLHFGITAKGIIFNAIDAEELNSIDQGLFNGKKFGVKRNKIICYVGRMIPEKGVIQLAEAFNELSNINNEYNLVMAGDGPLLSRLKEIAGQNIIFCGQLSRNECVALFKQSEIFCLPTVSEGFSTTLLEAAAAECFVITTEGCGGALEVFNNTDDAVITKGNSKEEIKSALISAVNDGERNEKTLRVAKRITQQLGWENSCDAIEQIDWRS